MKLLTPITACEAVRFKLPLEPRAWTITMCHDPACSDVGLGALLGHMTHERITKVLKQFVGEKNDRHTGRRIQQAIQETIRGLKSELMIIDDPMVLHGDVIQVHDELIIDYKVNPFKPPVTYKGKLHIK